MLSIKRVIIRMSARVFKHINHLLNGNAYVFVERGPHAQ